MRLLKASGLAILLLSTGLFSQVSGQSPGSAASISAATGSLTYSGTFTAAPNVVLEGSYFTVPSGSVAAVNNLPVASNSQGIVTIGPGLGIDIDLGATAISGPMRIITLSTQYRPLWSLLRDASGSYWVEKVIDGTPLNSDYIYKLWDPVSKCASQPCSDDRLFIQFLANGQVRLDEIATFSHGATYDWEGGLLNYGLPIQSYPLGQSGTSEPSSSAQLSLLQDPQTPSSTVYSLLFFNDPLAVNSAALPPQFGPAGTPIGQTKIRTLTVYQAPLMDVRSLEFNQVLPTDAWQWPCNTGMFQLSVAGDTSPFQIPYATTQYSPLDTATPCNSGYPITVNAAAMSDTSIAVAYSDPSSCRQHSVTVNTYPQSFWQSAAFLTGIGAVGAAGLAAVGTTGPAALAVIFGIAISQLLTISSYPQQRLLTTATTVYLHESSEVTSKIEVACTDGSSRGDAAIVAETSTPIPPFNGKLLAMFTSDLSDSAFSTSSAGQSSFTSLQTALGSLPASGGTIYLLPGTYTGPFAIKTPNVSIVGINRDGSPADPNTVILTGHLYEQESNGSGGTLGTTASATVSVSAANATFRSLSITNDANVAFGENIVQALALKVNADRAIFDHVRVQSGQDTIEVAGQGNRAYFVNSFIGGYIDFIFGNGNAVIENSEIQMVAHPDATLGLSAELDITADGSNVGGQLPTPNEGFLFDNDSINFELPNSYTDSTGSLQAYAYLGRPDGSFPYSETIWQNSRVDFPGVNVARYLDWPIPYTFPSGQTADPLQNATLGQYNLQCEDVSKTSFAACSTTGQVSEIQNMTSPASVASFLAGSDGWNPALTDPASLKAESPVRSIAYTSTASQINLSWRPPLTGSSDSYRVQARDITALLHAPTTFASPSIANADSVAWSTVANTTTTATNWSCLTQHTYQVTVTPILSDGSSGPSSSPFGIACLQPLPAVQIYGLEAGNGWEEITFGNVSSLIGPVTMPATLYTLIASPVSGGPQVSVPLPNQPNSAAPPYQFLSYGYLTGLANGQTYSFTVQASNASGLVTSTPVVGTVGPNANDHNSSVPPLSGVAVVNGNTSASISWAQNANASGFSVQAYVVDETESKTPIQLFASAGQTSLAVNNLINGDTYAVSLRYVNSSALGPTYEPTPILQPSSSNAGNLQPPSIASNFSTGTSGGVTLTILPPTSGPAPAYYLISTQDNQSGSLLGTVQVPASALMTQTVYADPGRFALITVISESAAGATSPCAIGSVATPSCSVPSPSIVAYSGGSNAALANGAFTMQNSASAFCLDNPNASTVPGTIEQQYSCNGTDAQSWTITNLNNGYVTIMNSGSRLYLNDTNASGNNGNSIQETTFNAGAAQDWLAIQNSDGTVTFVNQASGLVLGISHQGAAVGDRTNQYINESKPWQKWVVKTK